MSGMLDGWIGGASIDRMDSCARWFALVFVLSGGCEVEGGEKGLSEGDNNRSPIPESRAPQRQKHAA